MTYLFSSLSPLSPLEGQYRVKLPSFNVKLTISSKTFTLESCNKITFNYTVSAKTGEISFGKADSTKKACENDYDNVILSAILDTKQIYFSDSVITFVNSAGTVIGRTDKYVARPTVITPVVIPSSKPSVTKTATFPSGTYTVTYSKNKDIKTTTATVTNSEITLNCCKSYTIKYTAFADNTVKFEPVLNSVSSNSRNKCSDSSNDQYFLLEMRAVDTYSIDGSKVINFFDSSKKSYLKFAPTKATTPATSSSSSKGKTSY